MCALCLSLILPDVIGHGRLHSKAPDRFLAAQMATLGGVFSVDLAGFHTVGELII